MSEDYEKLLRPIDNDYAPFPPKYMELRNGDMMVIRQVGREVMPTLLPYIEPLLHVSKDYYDIVGARVYAELLGYYRYRTQDQYVLICQVDQELVGLVNGRFLSRDVGVSYHTLALRRGFGIGSRGFVTKMEYHLDIVKQKEVLVVAESPIGFRRWMETYGLAEKFDTVHELGGGPSYTLTNEIFDGVKGKLLKGQRPVPEELLKKNEEAILPPSDLPTND